jgi:hypothetical protein
MAQKLEKVKSVRKLHTDSNNVYLFRVDKIDNTHLFVVWQRRDYFYGEDEPKTAFSFHIGWDEVMVSDVFGNEEIKSCRNSTLYLNLSDTPLFVEQIYP